MECIATKTGAANYWEQLGLLGKGYAMKGMVNLRKFSTKNKQKNISKWKKKLVKNRHKIGEM